jgi:hypothetical protein
MYVARQQGLVVTHDWTIPVMEWADKGGDASVDDVTRYALARAAIDGVIRAQVLWLLTPERGSLGAGVELGTAIAYGKKIVASGSTRSIFGSLATVEVDDDARAMAKVLAIFEDLERGRP